MQKTEDSKEKENNVKTNISNDCANHPYICKVQSNLRLLALLICASFYGNYSMWKKENLFRFPEFLKKFNDANFSNCRLSNWEIPKWQFTI